MSKGDGPSLPAIEGASFSPSTALNVTIEPALAKTKSAWNPQPIVAGLYAAHCIREKTQMRHIGFRSSSSHLVITDVIIGNSVECT